MIRRREFITLIGGAAAWPLAAGAQQLKLPTVGFLGQNTAWTQSRWTAAFVERLRDLGWTEGRTIAIEYLWAEGRSGRFGEFAAEFVRRKVDLIVAFGAAIPAIKQVTSPIPIVFTIAGDPVGSGFVASLAHPGGNITGLSLQQTDLAGKRLQLFREVVPSLRRVALLANVDASGSALELAEVQAAASGLGLDAVTLAVHRAQDINAAFATLNGRVQGLYVCGDPLAISNSARIHTLAMAARLPAIYGERHHVEAGGLISYGPAFADRYRRAAEFVDKILRGTKPADIPVEQPTKFELILNLTTAQALGLNIPTSLLVLADEVIE